MEQEVRLGDRFIPTWDVKSGEWEAEAWEGLGIVVMQCKANKRRERRVREETLLNPRQWTRVQAPTQ